MTSQEYQRDYRKAVIKELESRGLSDEEVEKELKKIMGTKEEVLEVSLETIITNDDGKLKVERGTWCDTCDSKGRVHKLGCLKRLLK